MDLTDKYLLGRHIGPLLADCKGDAVCLFQRAADPEAQWHCWKWSLGTNCEEQCGTQSSEMMTRFCKYPGQIACADHLLNPMLKVFSTLIYSNMHTIVRKCMKSSETKMKNYERIFLRMNIQKTVLTLYK